MSAGPRGPHQGTQRPYYDCDGITIYHGDCREVGCLDATVMLTDPPWGVNKAVWDDDFVLPPVSDMIRGCGLMPGLWNLPRCPVELAPGLQYKWTLAAHLVNGMTRGAVGFGNWIACLLYSLNGISLHEQETDIRRFTVGREDKPDHPSPKPLAPVRWFLSRLPGGRVIDPFMGSGTTLLAAKAARRRAIGIEIEERYCEIAARRLDQTVLAL